MALTLEEVGQFLASPPPREPSGEIRTQAMKGSGGGCLMIFGMIFFLVGLFALYMLEIWRIADEARIDAGTTETVTATVVSASKTNVSVGGGNGRSGTPVYQYRFRFLTEGGASVEGMCFTTGKRYDAGEEARAEYLPDAPQLCRLKGTRRSLTGYAGLLVLLFPLVGGGIVFFSWRWRQRRMRLLREGIFATGTITDVESTNVRVNNRRRYKVHVTYNDGAMDHDTTYNAYGEDVDYAREKMNRGEAVGLLYDPDAPGRVLVADSLITGTA